MTTPDAASSAPDAPPPSGFDHYATQLTFNVKDFRLRAAFGEADDGAPWQLRRWAAGTAQLERPSGSIAPREKPSDRVDQVPLTISPCGGDVPEPGLLYAGADGGLYVKIPAAMFDEMAVDYHAGRIAKVGVMIRVHRAWTIGPYDHHYEIENQQADYRSIPNCTLVSLNWASPEAPLVDSPGILATKEAANQYWERQEEEKEREAEQKMRRGEARAAREAPILRAIYSVSNHLAALTVAVGVLVIAVSVRGCSI